MKRNVFMGRVERRGACMHADAKVSWRKERAETKYCGVHIRHALRCLPP